MVIGSSFFALAAFDNFALTGVSSLPLQNPSSSSGNSFGSVGTSFTGWLMPSQDLISTSYVVNHSLSQFVSATLNVFPYQLPSNGVLYLGLYINGKLSANMSYNLGQSVATPAAIVQSLASQPPNKLASFTPSLEGYSVTVFLHSPLPAGTTITVSASVTEPIWVQIDSGAVVHSQMLSTNSVALPAAAPLSSALSPYTLSIQVDSNAS